jgi:pimeloyl-ACP methyl ester carboxylesterase
MATFKYRFHGETKVLDDAARAAAPGQFIELPDGITHYELGGPPSGQSVVLVHGFSVPYYIWDPTFAALTKNGFRVLRYDLYGRGYSDRPNTRYDANLFVRQLLHLLTALQFPTPVHLIGLSMGGPITVAFTDRYPDKVGKLCLIDPAGFPTKRSLGDRLLVLPLVWEWAIDHFGEKLLISNLLADFYKPEDFPEYQALFREQMSYRGFRGALLSTLRSGIIHNMVDCYTRVGTQQRAILLLWGCQDQVVPFALNEKVRNALPDAKFYPISDAGHIPHYERPDKVNPILTDFLEERTPA